MPFKDAEQKRAYMESFRQKKREAKEEARIEMIHTVNNVISQLNPTDVNGLLLIDTDLTYYKSFGDFRRSHPNASYPEYEEYSSDQKIWLFTAKSERIKAVQRAFVYLDQFEPQTKVWRKQFPKFFSKYEEVSQSWA